MSTTVKIDIKQLPHAEGLALPAYQSADAAGMDLLAAYPRRERPLSPPLEGDFLILRDPRDQIAFLGIM